MKNIRKKVRFHFNLKSKHLLVIMTLFCGSCIVATAASGTTSAPLQNVAGFLVVPFEKGISGVSNMFGDVKSSLRDKQDVLQENEELKNQINSLTEQNNILIQDQTELTRLKELYNLDQEYTDYPKVAARVISGEPDNWYNEFIIDKGTLQGVAKRDPVITSDGLIGVIEEVGLTYSRVITLHDPSLNVGAYVSRTRDTGIVVGAVDLAQDGQCKMTYLPRDSGAAIGDMILTSGGNVFPKGLKIGTIKEIRQESHGVSLYAVIEPFASVADAKDVFVITSFEGQGIVVGEDLGQNDAPIEESEANEDTSSLPAADSSSAEAGQ